MAVVSPMLVSCDKPLDTYSGESGIYFDTQHNKAELQSDTVPVHWGMKNSSVTSQTISLRVKLFGHTKPYDRKFTIEVGALPGDTAAAEVGVDYEMPATEYTIPANQAFATVQVKLLRRPDLRERNRRLTLKLVESPELKFLYTRQVGVPDSLVDGGIRYKQIDLQRVILLDEHFPQPIWWDQRGTPFFGTWTMKKAALICDVMNIDREAWVDPAELSEGYLKFCGKFMHRWLLEHPTNEDDGTPMKMGTQSTN